MSDDKEREAFEAWFEKEYGSKPRKTGTAATIYDWNDLRDAWKAALRSRKLVLPEKKRVDSSTDNESLRDYFDGFNTAIDEIRRLNGIE